MQHGPATRTFATTHWSVIQAALDGSSAAARETLCATYWQPAYAFIRRSGSNAEDARDLNPGFSAATASCSCFVVDRLDFPRDNPVRIVKLSASMRTDPMV